MRRGSLVLVATLAAVCVSAAPAAGQEAREPEGQDEVPPVLSLLGHRERLSLTSEQIAALDSIAHVWDVENERLTTRGMMVSSGLGGASVSTVRSTGASRKEAAANNLRAARAVEAVLTSEQRRLVCETPSPRRATRSPWPWCNAGSPES